MKERPILFSGPMVRAILEGRKTQTRRVVVPQPTKNRGSAGDVYPFDAYDGALAVNVTDDAGGYQICQLRSPFGEPGDRLWVRETFARCTDGHMGAPTIAYAATDEQPRYFQGFKAKWTSSRFMPRAASRLSLEVVAIRAERLQTMPVDDVGAEGAILRWHDGPGNLRSMVSAFDGKAYLDATSLFRTGWDALNGKRRVATGADPATGKLVYRPTDAYAWAANPWVWVVTFRRAA